tara:strand:- start:180 stop:452 length:273 start_codon:yes stop_codon:yes gene_type:complete
MDGYSLPDDKKRLKSNRERVMRLMLDLKWHSANEICQPEIGGREGLRRLRELRKQGYVVSKRRVKEAGGAYEYRIVALMDYECQDDAEAE